MLIFSAGAIPSVLEPAEVPDKAAFFISLLEFRLHAITPQF
jgi:hypothetical protein